MIGEAKKRKPRLWNCYYCEVPTLETKLTRKTMGSNTILYCGNCRKKPKKKVKLLKRKVDKCQQV